MLLLLSLPDSAQDRGTKHSADSTEIPSGKRPVKTGVPHVGKHGGLYWTNSKGKKVYDNPGKKHTKRKTTTRKKKGLPEEQQPDQEKRGKKDRE
jgi:hypothetical protein